MAKEATSPLEGNIENTKPFVGRLDLDLARGRVKVSSHNMSALVWGVPIENLYKHILQYYRKEKERLRLDYNQRMALLALFKQIKLGAYSPDKDTETGYFDVIGSDRRKAWIALGSRSKEEAQKEVIQLLESACPTLKDEVLKHLEEAKQTLPEKRNGICSRDQHEEEFTVKVINNKTEGEGKIHQAPANGSSSVVNSSPHSIPSASPPNGFSPERPASHHSPQKSQEPSPSPSPASPQTQPCRSQASVSPQLPRPQFDPSPQPQALNPQQSRQMPLPPPSLWCSPNSAQKFMVQMRSSPSTTLVLSPGERLSVQVPTSPQASAIIWEFAADHGDIGFGLYFQRGGANVAEQLIPPSPRDCCVDLFIGKHQYQEQGIYLLEFINTHPSRQKTVFYRVFYETATAQQ